MKEKLNYSANNSLHTKNLYFNPRFTKKSGEVIMYDNEKEIVNKIVEDIVKNPRFPTSNFNTIIAQASARLTNG